MEDGRIIEVNMKSSAECQAELEDIMNFGSWDDSIHTDIDQVKRIASAKKAATTPTKVDHENEVAEFKGSGKELYFTTFDSCTCRDFTVRKLPCKHIYRLALELVSCSVEVGVNKNDILNYIFSHPPSVQAALYDLIDDFKADEHISAVRGRTEAYDTLLHSGLIIETVVNEEYIKKLDIHLLKNFLQPFDICKDILIKKVPQKRQYLIDWVSENASVIIPMIQEHFIVLEFTEQLDEVKKELYTRFRRKFIRETILQEALWDKDVKEEVTVLKKFFSQE